MTQQGMNLLGKLSIKWKILGPLVIVGLLLVVFVAVFTLRAFRSHIEHEVGRRADIIINSVTYAAESITDRPSLERFVTTLGADREVDLIVLVDDQSRVIASSIFQWNGLGLDALPDGDVRDRLESQLDRRSGAPVGLEPSRAVDGLMEFAVPVRFEQAGEALQYTDGAIFVRIDPRAILGNAWSSAWQLLAWLLLGLILAPILASSLLIEVVLKPLNRLHEFVRRHRSSDGVDAALIEQEDEFGQLARAVNDAFKATRESEARLALLAQSDALTGLGNRAKFKEQLQKDLRRCEQTGHSVAIILLDLDHFKNINDTLGHDIGDQLLREAASILSHTARATDTIVRLGGDEFAFIVPNLVSTGIVNTMAERIISTLSKPMTISGHDIQPGVSVGITIFPQDGRDPDALLKNADLALYRAKAEGRGNYQFYRRELHLRAMERNAIERDLRTALSSNQFVLHYQPKVDLQSGHVTGAEALVRWRHPDRGLVPPGLFIPVAESNGFIVELTRWVMEQACTQARKWQDEGLPPLGIAVNVSALDLRRGDLTDQVAGTLIRTGLSPQYLELEVTESMVMRDVDEVIGTLRRLRGLGVGIAIDDFGTGYSSLAYLKRFPVKRLKIDRSFVQDMGRTPESRAIPRVIVDLARSLGVRVLAEGVETADQLDALRQMGCDEAQGYFLGRPMPSEEFVQLVRHGDQKTGVAGDPTDHRQAGGSAA